MKIVRNFHYVTTTYKSDNCYKKFIAERHILNTYVLHQYIDSEMLYMAVERGMDSLQGPRTFSSPKHPD
jgi:hypothetical protein